VDKAQVVAVNRSRLEPATVEMAVLMDRLDGNYTHRRVRCAGVDVIPPLFMFETDPRVAAHAGNPSQPRWVQDQSFETADAALLSAAEQQPAPKSRSWTAREDVAFLLDEGFRRRLQPEAADLRPLQIVLVLSVFWVVAGVIVLGDWVLLLPSAASDVHGFLDFLRVCAAVLASCVVLFGAFWVGLVVDEWLRGVLSRHNLDRAINGGQARSIAHELRRDLHAAGLRMWARVGNLRTRKKREPGRHAGGSRRRSPFLGGGRNRE
jgi:hypothetical protein